MTTEEQIRDYCQQHNIQLTDIEIDYAVDMVDNYNYTIEEAVTYILNLEEPIVENQTKPPPKRPS